jgi:cyanophycin synthetase
MDIKNVTKAYHNSIGRALQKRSIPHFRIVKKTSIFQAGLGYKQRRFVYDDISSAVARRICNNKNYTKYFLEQINAPIPKGECVHDEIELGKYFKKMKKPLVIKPISEMWGKGVTTGIITFDEALQAYRIARKYHGEYVIMEEHISGDDHRILYVGGKYVAGLKRIPPFVIGNGRDAIESLIRKENMKREKSNKAVKEIIIDETVVNFLKSQGITLSSIPVKGEVVKVRMTGNICSGGISENITETVHPSIIEMGRQVISCLDLEIGGIDVITTDITKSLEESGGRISEVNQNPDIGMHTNPYFGKSIPTAQVFVDYLFPDKKDAWIEVKKGSRKIANQKELNKYLGIVPKKVIQKESLHSKKRIIIKKPQKTLLNYLLSNLTLSVDL